MNADGTGVVSTGVGGYPSSWIREIGPGVDLERAGLSGANLVGVDLSGANLSGAGLTAATLTGADLSGANFTYAHLVFAGLLGANLDGANLTGARLDSATLVGARLVEANLIGADLVGTYANEETVWPDDFDPETAGVKFGSSSSRTLSSTSETTITEEQTKVLVWDSGRGVTVQLSKCSTATGWTEALPRR